VRQIGLADSELARLGHAIRWIRVHYDQTLRVEELATLATMAFRRSTATSAQSHDGADPVSEADPLHEARVRLIAERGTSQALASNVGYDSPSQFSREYRRMFGAPPSSDALALRESAALPILSVNAK